MSLVNYRPLESPVAQMSAVAGLVASTAQSLSLSFQEKSVLLRICQSFGSSVMYDVYRSVDGVVDSEPMVSGVSDAFYLSVVLGQENSILVLSLRADGYYPILLTVSYLYEKDLLFISQVGAIGEMKYKTFNSTELSQNLDYTIDSFTAVPDLSIDTLPKVIDFLSGFVTTDNLKQYIADQVAVFEVVQGPGSSTTAVMSQNAVTEELRKKASVESVVESISVHNTSATAHADIRELLNTCVGLPSYDSSSYKITFTTLAGATVEVDLPIEQLALRYNAATECIEFDNADGTTTSIPVSAFVKEYVGSIGDRIQVSIDENNVIHATILKNSIDWGCLSFELQERINDHVTSADFATKAVRTDIAQTLSLAAQNQALENIGADLMIIDLVNGQATLTDEQEAQLLSCKGVILRGTINADNEALTKIYFSDYQGGDTVDFFAIQNNKYCLKCSYTKSTKIFKFIDGTDWINPAYVSAYSSQDFSASEQAQAWLNLGLDLVVLKFPKGVTSLTLTDAEDAKLAAGAAVLVRTDSTDTTSNLYNINNHIFTTVDSRATSTPLYYSLALYSGLFYCTYNRASKTFVYQGIIRLIDSGAVRFDRKTSLTSAQQSQAFENLGWKVHVISESAIGSSDAVSDVEKAARLSATALLVQETGLLYNFSISSGGSRRFYGQFSNSFCTALNVNEATGVITSSFAYLYDPSAVSFDRDQSSVSDDNKNKALGNIGIDFVRLPYSLLGTTLSDEMLEVVDNARGIILVATPSGYRNPTVFVKGNNISESCIFVSFVTGNTYCIFTLNKSTKLLSGISSGLTYGGSVRYVEGQSLTATQKDTVLSNIGLKWVNVPYSLLNTTLDDATYTKLTNAYGIILTDAPSGYYGPLEFICGANNSDGAKVFAGLHLANTSAYIVLYVNHNLTNVRYARTYDGAVPYDASKTLTSAQQDVALSNIGLDFVHVDYALLDTILDDSTAALVENANGIVLTNTPESYSKASVFLKSVYSNNIIYFNAWNGVSLVSQFSYNISTKQLTAVSATDLHFDSVRYNVSQDLTDVQKQQARTNIGVKSANELLEDADFIAQLKTKLGIA